MSQGFERRQDGFEKKFKLEQEQQFRANARRNKKLGRWAAERMGIGEEDIDAYISEVIRSDFEEAGDDDVFRKIKADLEAKGQDVPDAELRSTMDRFLEDACREIAEEG